MKLYTRLLVEIKTRIGQAQTRAILAANAELVRLYWDIGRLIDHRQKERGWGAGVIPKLARDLHNELPEIKGFSERNIKQMLAFHREYHSATAIVQQPVAQLPPHSNESNANRFLPVAVAKIRNKVKMPPPAAQIPGKLLMDIPWGHHITLMGKIKAIPTRLWYMEQTLANGWSRSVLDYMIGVSAHKRQGKAVSNFSERLPASQCDLIRQTLKDPYIFDFLTLEEPFHERELETTLVRHLEKFLIALGRGFAFVGRQHRLEVGDQDFYIDLLFYHLTLRCFVVIELKKGGFKPEYAGKLNFYCNAVDDKLKHAQDHPTIGLILCQTKNRVLAEYALRGIAKPIGVAGYELTRALPKNLRSALPDIRQIEAEMARDLKSTKRGARAAQPKNQ